MINMSFECKKCGKEFASKMGLLGHLRVHNKRSNSTQRNATQLNATLNEETNATLNALPNATQRNADGSVDVVGKIETNATQLNATQRNATQRNAALNEETNATLNEETNEQQIHSNNAIESNLLNQIIDPKYKNNQQPNIPIVQSNQQPNQQPNKQNKTFEFLAMSAVNIMQDMVKSRLVSKPQQPSVFEEAGRAAFANFLGNFSKSRGSAYGKRLPKENDEEDDPYFQQQQQMAKIMTNYFEDNDKKYKKLVEQNEALLTKLDNNKDKDINNNDDKDNKIAGLDTAINDDNDEEQHN